MNKLLPQPERLNIREVILPVSLVLLLAGLTNGIIKHKEITDTSEAFLFYLSMGIWLLFFPSTGRLLKIRFTRLFNTLLWLAPCAILFFLHHWIVSDPVLAAGMRQDLLSQLRLPLYSFVYMHVMRLVHILLYNTEPLIGAWYGPVVVDEENRWEAIPSDKGFTVVHGLGYLVILIVLFK